MKWKNIAAAAAMAVLFAPAMAADQSITLVGGNGSFIGTGPLLAGGDDVISLHESKVVPHPGYQPSSNRCPVALLSQTARPG